MSFINVFYNLFNFKAILSAICPALQRGSNLLSRKLLKCFANFLLGLRAPALLPVACRTRGEDFGFFPFPRQKSFFKKEKSSPRVLLLRFDL